MRLACLGLFSWLEKKAIVVTPSRLLASVAAQEFTEHQLHGSLDSWQRPLIYTVDAWLTACWQEARYSGSGVPTLLSPAQERLVWQEIIEREEPDLFDVPSTARLAMTAYRLMAEWNISPGGDPWSDHQDARHFERWYSRFRDYCRQRGWMARSDIWRLLPVWLESGLCDRQLTAFAAFETVAPALEQVKQALGAFAAMAPVSPGVQPSIALVQQCASFDREIEHAARWARAAFERDAHSSVAVFVPGLEANRALIERTFDRVFYPGRALDFTRVPGMEEPHHSRDCVFHIAAASPLNEQPIITNALLLLELGRTRIALPDAGAILRSPYIAGAQQERSKRAFADLRLRRLRDLDVSLAEIEASAAGCTLLRPALARLREKTGNSSRQHLDLAAWSEFIQDLLEAAGWPGDMPSDEELVIVERWKQAVSTLASLSMVSKPVPYDQAVGLLRGILSREGTERGDWSSPIQVSEASEAFALEFDQAFLTSLSDENWPPPLAASSLIPLSVQRAHGVPGSSRLSSHAIRERITESLFRTARSIRASFSGQLSPFAQKFVQFDVPPMDGWQGKLPIQSFGPVALEEIEDSDAPPFTGFEPVRGGTGIIKSQSLCPFRAFAEYRLRSEIPEEACFGFDSRDRGQFLHTALQIVWAVLRAQDRLRAMQQFELREIVRNAVIEAVRDDASSPFHQLTTAAERDRLENLILEWLEIERSRSQPFTVETVEEQRFYEIPGLRLRLRVDRIDRLKDGSVILIDYKSGKQTAGKLEGERLAEPQLLVYASTVQAPVTGVYFGQLRPRELRAVGFGRERHFSSRSASVKKDWNSFIEQSISNVERIARGFVSGRAVVDPLKGACDYCSQKPFCRIREASAIAGEGELEGE